MGIKFRVVCRYYSGVDKCGYVGSMNPYQGIGFILEAFEFRVVVMSCGLCELSWGLCV